MAGDTLVCVSLLETRLGSSRSGMRERKRHLQEPPPSTCTQRFRGHRPPAAQRRSGSGPGRRRFAIAPRDRDATTYSSGPPRRRGAAGADRGSPSSRGGSAGRCPSGRGLSARGAVTVTGRALPPPRPEPPQTSNVSEGGVSPLPTQEPGLERGCALAARPKAGSRGGQRFREHPSPQPPQQCPRASRRLCCAESSSSSPHFVHLFVYF